MEQSPAAKILKKKGIHLERTIGRGRYSTLKRAFDRRRDRVVAVKIVDHKRCSQRYLSEFLPSELCILTQVNHRSVVLAFESFSKKRRTFIVTEHMAGGSLVDFLRLRGRLIETNPKDHCHTLFRQLLQAVHFLHSKAIVHRNLKCDNILLDMDGNAKISDFAFSVQISRNQLLTASCGTFAYAAPELLQGEPYRGPPSDVWNLGVVLFAIVTGNLPFAHSDRQQLIRLQARGATFPNNFPSRSAVSLIRAMLQMSPLHRPTAAQAMVHPWIRHTPYHFRS